MKNVIKKAYERGVQIEILAPIKEGEEVIEELRPYVRFRNVSSAPARYCVVDDKEALLILTNSTINPEYDIGIWLNSEAVGKLLSRYF